MITIMISEGKVMVESNGYVWSARLTDLDNESEKELDAIGFNREIESNCRFMQWSIVTNWEENIFSVDREQISHLWWHLH